MKLLVATSCLVPIRLFVGVGERLGYFSISEGTKPLSLQKWKKMQMDIRLPALALSQFANH